MTPPIPPDQLAELEKLCAAAFQVLLTTSRAQVVDPETAAFYSAARRFVPALIAATRRLHQLEGEPKGVKPATKNKTRDTVTSYCTRTGEIS